MRVGIASTTITPDRPIWMTGFASRTAPSEGEYNDLEASAVVFDDRTTRVGILALDLVGIDEFLLEPIRARAAELGIAADHLLINCSHTHCAPACRVVRGSCRKFDDEYLAGLIETSGRLLEEAISDLREARLDHTVGECTMGVNRRRLNEEGMAAGMLPAPDRPNDTDVPVMRVMTPEEEIRAVLFSYACHPTTMGGQLIGTDYPGPARGAIREAIPECAAIFLQGCGGDVKPRNVTGDGRFASGPVEMVREIGHELGRAALTAMCGEMDDVGEGLGGLSDIAELPARPPMTEDEFTALEQGNAWEQKWVEVARKTIAEKGGLAETLPVEVQVLTIGDLAIVGMGGEICSGIGEDVKTVLADRNVWTLGYSNLLRSYVASRGAHAEGGYEVRDSFVYSWTPEPRPLGLAPESVDVLVGAAVRLVNDSQRRRV